MMKTFELFVDESPRSKSKVHLGESAGSASGKTNIDIAPHYNMLND